MSHSIILSNPANTMVQPSDWASSYLRIFQIPLPPVLTFRRQFMRCVVAECIPPAAFITIMLSPSRRGKEGNGNTGLVPFRVGLKNEKQ